MNRYDFLHPGPSLRVAATLRNRAGETIAFRRRRGNKNTLLADEDAETLLRDDALAPSSAASRRMSSNAVSGLNSQRLQDGARAMISGEEARTACCLPPPPALAACATCARHSPPKPTGSSRRARRRSASSIRRWRPMTRRGWTNATIACGPATGRRSTKAIAASEAEVDEARTALTELRKRQARLQQLDQFDKLLAEVREHERTLGDFADPRRRGDGFGRSLRDRLDARDRARTAHRAATEALQDAERARDGSPRPGAPGEGRRGHRAFRPDGSLSRAAQDIPRVQAQVDEQTQDLAALLRRLGLGALPTDSESLGARQPSDATLATVGDGI
ncbi:MAG: AAA family ATPase [Alphaproteobacteria bacterium]|nr:AAA family ATPase [Alphaproteobacteria bacterium]